MFAVVAHGGAGSWKADKRDDALDGLRDAVAIAVDALRNGAQAIDAAVAATHVLEDNPLYNAGTGASLNIDGVVELDACVMDGATGLAGAVTGLQRVRYPIDVARLVMERTDHVLLSGDGAIRFARAMGVPDHEVATEDRLARFRERLRALRRDGDRWLPRLRDLIAAHPELCHGTIGVTVRDAAGQTCACTSTGGVVLKLAGRVGDTPMLGAGTWADAWGAASATGRGEVVMRTLATRVLCMHIAGGMDAQTACERTLEDTRAVDDDQVGWIAVDRDGGVGAAHGTEAMPHAWFRQGMSAPTARMTMR